MNWLRRFWYSACLSKGQRDLSDDCTGFQPGVASAAAKHPIPRELEAERICVQHFMISIESACTVMRREAAMEGANMARRREIEELCEVDRPEAIGRRHRQRPAVR